MMPNGTVMVPRVFKTNIGDIFTTNCVNGVAENNADVVVGAILSPNATGILTVDATPDAGAMQWQVVKVYTLADRQKAVKLMRTA